MANKRKTPVKNKAGLGPCRTVKKKKKGPRI